MAVYIHKTKVLLVGGYNLYTMHAQNELPVSLLSTNLRELIVLCHPASQHTDSLLHHLPAKTL